MVSRQLQPKIVEIADMTITASRNVGLASEHMDSC
jgi:hypothetical protein